MIRVIELSAGFLAKVDEGTKDMRPEVGNLEYNKLKENYK